MKHFLRLAALLAICFLFAPSTANAVNCGTGTGTCFWIPGGGPANWSASTNWSNTDGGASCTCTVATGDAVLFTSNSGTNTSTINANVSISTLDATGSSALTLAHNAAVTLTVTGDLFKFSGSLVYNPGGSTSRLVSFTPTAGHTVLLTSNGQRFDAISVSTAIVQAQDNVRIDSVPGPLTLTASGTFDANGKTVIVGSINAAAGTTLAFGAGAWSVIGPSAVVWTTTSTTTITGSATVTFATPTASRTIAGGGNTSLPAFAFSTSAFPTTISGTNTFVSMAVTAPNVLVLTTGTTQTITGAATWTGTASSPILLYASTPGSAASITFSGGATMSWLGYSSITCSGTITSANSLDFGNNTNCGITAPSGGGRIIGG